MKKFLSMILALFLLFSLFPAVYAADPTTVTVDDVQYRIENGTATVVSYDGQSSTLTIPSSVLGVPVTAIKDRAFSYHAFLRAIRLPDSLQKIGECAFQYTSIKAIAIPSTMKRVDDSAFEFAYQLEKVTLPEGLEEIGFCAFSGCEKLSVISFPSTLKTLGSNAFAGTALTSIDLPNGLETIGEACFTGSELKEITLPASVVSVDDSAFSWCEFLERADFSASALKTLPDHCFDMSRKLSEVHLPDSLQVIGEHAFDMCKEIRSIEIPAGVTTIGSNAFAHCDGLTSVVIPDGVEELSTGVFADCYALEFVTLPKGLKKIGDAAFRCCIMKELNLPASLESIGWEAFSGCAKLSYLELGPNVVSLGSGAFSNCSGLKGMVIPDGVHALPDDLFAYDKALEWVVIPDSVVEFGNRVFVDCVSLEYVRLPAKTEVISRGLFHQCTSLKYISMPSTVRSIEAEAFLLCDALQAIEYPGTEQQLKQIQIDPDGNEALANVGVFLISGYPDYWYGFYDMPDESEWSYEGIAFCLDNGFMKGMGDGLFQPNGTTTRAQLVTILWRMCDEPAAAKAASFNDTQDHWAKDAISWAAENGIVNGMGEGIFAPDAPITREQLVTIFHRFCKEYLEMDVSKTKALDTYPDADAVSDWAKDAMQWGVAVRLISGVGTPSGDVLQPQGSATRAQIAKVILNFFENIYTE